MEGEPINLTPQDITISIMSQQRNKARSNTADWLIQNNHIATMRDTEEIYIYNGGYYEPYGDKTIKEQIKPMWGEEITVHDINEITKAHIIPQTYIERETFNTELELTCLQNGILNLKTRELTPHDPTHKFTFQIPVEWNPEAECPQIEEFLNTTLDKADIPLIYQCIGYCLWRGYPIHKAFMYVGDGSNGKSTLINLIKALLGRDNICSKSLQELVYNRFAASQLYGRHANLFADLSDKALNQTGPFKMLTGGDTLDAEKKFKDAFQFVNYAKLIYSANKLPEVADTTTAFFRRWVIVNFPNTFDDTTADKNIITKLTTPDELSGLLKNAVIALGHLLEEGQFIRSETTDEIETRYVKLSNSVAAFVEEILEENSEAEPVGRGELYIIYAEYCRDNDLILKSQQTFTKTLKEFVRVEDCRTGNDRAWRGISIKEDRYKRLEDFHNEE